MIRRLGIPSWPIWLKLLVGLSLAVAIPAALSFVALQPGLRDFNLSSLRTYISENGQRQDASLNSVFQQARDDLRLFVAQDVNNRRLTSAILRSTPLMTQANFTVTPEDISSLLQTGLLNPSTTLYNSARVIDRSGRLVSIASATSSSVAPISKDQSDSVAFRAAANELLKSSPRSQFVTVSSVQEHPLIEIIQRIDWRDGSPIGYLVVELDNQRVIYDRMAFAEADSPAYSFLVTLEGALITPAKMRAPSIVAQKGPGAARALDGQIGTDTYALPGSGQEVVGYYAPISDTPLAFVAESPSNYVLGQQQTLFDARFLIIVLATPALVLLLTLVLIQLIAAPLERLRDAVQGVIEGDFARPVRDNRRGDEIGRLATTVVSMREQVQGVVDDLETRIAERGRDMAATQEIGRVAVSQRDVQPLLDTVVNLIIERFPLIYHAQVFLIDPERRYAVLQASTNEPGRLLLARGHRLAVGSISVVGQATEQGRSVVTLDTAASPVHRRNELLPDTVAELAVPLRIGSRVIGALDVQSRQRDAFDEDMIAVLETVADQIAVAYQNAQLYQESLQRMEEVEQSNRLTTLRVWQEYMREQRTQVLAGSAGSPVEATHLTLRERALATGEVAVGEPTERATVPLAVPVILRGQPLGVVEWEIPVRDLDQNRIQLAKDLAARLAVSLDNARLFEDSARSAERERLVNNIAARLAAQTDIDDILQTAVREIGLALRVPQVSVRLGNGVSATSGNGNGHHHGDLN